MNFFDSLDFVLDHEGGDKYTNYPDDPGGETKFGIAKRYHPDVDIKNLTHEQASEIYLKQYWMPCRCDELPGLLRLAVFDAAVNPGPGAAVKFLQRALGVAADGVIGPFTIKTAQSATSVHLVKMITERILYYSSRDGFPKEGEGWIGRCLDVALCSK